VSGIAVSSGASDAVLSGGINHHLLLQYRSSNTILVDTTFSGYQKNKLTFNINPSTLESATTRFRHQVPNDLGVAADYQAVAFVEITYPHTPNLEGTTLFKMKIPFNTLESKTRYDFVSFSSTMPWAFSLTGQMRKIPV